MSPLRNPAVELLPLLQSELFSKSAENGCKLLTSQEVLPHIVRLAIGKSRPAHENAVLYDELSPFLAVLAAVIKPIKKIFFMFLSIIIY